MRQLALASALAYQRSTVDDPFTDAQATVEMAGDNIIVAFRGSSAPKDFLQDAEFWMTELMWSDHATVAEVHHGFLEDFNAINVAVVEQVKKLLAAYGSTESRPTIYLTGHSLGGALAILCALEFARQKLAVTQVTTFGGPRVGNAAFRNIYDTCPVGDEVTRLKSNSPGTNQSLLTSAPTLKDITFRVVNQNDIVPRTPGVLLGYHHVGQEIFLPAGTGWQLNPSLPGKLFSDALGLWGAYRRREDVLIANHIISSYARRIQLIS